MAMVKSAVNNSVVNAIARIATIFLVFAVIHALEADAAYDFFVCNIEIP